jgi:hypothetical protein
VDEDTKNMVKAIFGGKDAAQIEAELLTSSHAGTIKSPKVLAAYLASVANGDE